MRDKIDHAIKSKSRLLIFLGMAWLVILSPVLALAQGHKSFTKRPAKNVAELRSRLDGHWRYFETTIKLTAEGRQFTLRTRFGCEPRVKWLVTGPVIEFKRMIPLYGALRLPSGAALIVGTPQVCNGPTADQLAADPDKDHEPTVHQGYIPGIVWLDDAENPKVIERYVSQTYFKSRSASVQVHLVTTRPLPRTRPTNVANRIGWLKKIDRQLEKCRTKRCAPAFSGLYATVVPSDVWKREPEVARILRSVRRSGPLSRKDSTKVYQYFKTAVTTINRGNVPTDKYRASLHPKWLAANRRLFPIVIEAGRFSIDKGRPGAIVYYRLPIQSRAELRLFGQPVPDRPYLRDWRFDVPTQALYHLGRSDIYRVLDRPAR